MSLDFDANPMMRRVKEYMEKVAQKMKFRYSLRESHANRELLVAVWDMANMTAANQTGENLDKLKQLAYELVLASRMGEMAGCFFHEPDEEEMENLRRMFNHSMLRLDYEDVKWTDIETRPTVIEYNLETDDETVLKRQPNVQLKLFEDNNAL